MGTPVSGWPDRTIPGAPCVNGKEHPEPRRPIYALSTSNRNQVAHSRLTRGFNLCDPRVATDRSNERTNGGDNAAEARARLGGGASGPRYLLEAGIPGTYPSCLAERAWYRAPVPLLSDGFAPDEREPHQLPP